MDTRGCVRDYSPDTVLHRNTQPRGRQWVSRGGAVWYWKYLKYLFIYFSSRLTKKKDNVLKFVAFPTQLGVSMGS